jgi:integrase/recombinase XerC
MASWRAFLGDIDAADLTARRIDDYMLWRRESKITETTLRKNCLACRQFCAWARRQEIMTADPWDGIKLPVEGPGNEVILDAQQERSYLIFRRQASGRSRLGAADASAGAPPKRSAQPAERRHRPRPSPRKDGCTCAQSKTPAGIRTLPLVDETNAMLAKRAGTPGPWIFPGFRRRKDSGRLIPDPSVRLTYSGIINAHNRICIAAGLDFCIYSLRHTFATRFYEVTKDLAALKDVLGHSRISMVMRYVHDRAERIRSSMAAFEAGTRKEVSPRPS